MKNMLRQAAILALLINIFSSSGCHASGGGYANVLSISPSPDCTLELQAFGGAKLRKIDETRIQISYADNPVSSEVRVICEFADPNEFLANSGFLRNGDSIEFADGSGSKLARRFRMNKWIGVAATYFQGDVCQIVVGHQEENANNKNFLLDMCVSKGDFDLHFRDVYELERYLHVLSR
jgi:hypothetical protein